MIATQAGLRLRHRMTNARQSASCLSRSRRLLLCSPHQFTLHGAMDSFQWPTGFGDPTIVGALNLLAYVVVTWLCLQAYRVEKSGPPRPYRKTIPALVRVLWRRWPAPPAPARRAAIWLGLAVVLLGVGVAARLELHTWATEFGRSLAHEQGWYERRRTIQLVLIGLAALGGLAAVSALWWLSRKEVRSCRVAMGALLLLLTFALLRMTSFHHLDGILERELAGASVHSILELLVLFVIAGSAGWRIYQVLSTGPTRARVSSRA